MGQVRPIHFLSLHESTLKYDSTHSLSCYGLVAAVVKIRFERSALDDGSATGDGPSIHCIFQRISSIFSLCALGVGVSDCRSGCWPGNPVGHGMLLLYLKFT